MQKENKNKKKEKREVFYIPPRSPPSCEVKCKLHLCIGYMKTMGRKMRRLNRLQLCGHGSACEATCLAGATWSGQLVPVARLACLLLASENIEGGRKAVGDKKYFKNTCTIFCARSCVYGESVVFSPYNTVTLKAETAWIHQFSSAFFFKNPMHHFFSEGEKSNVKCSYSVFCAVLYCVRRVLHACALSVAF